jgi:hypothetical protein
MNRLLATMMLLAAPPAAAAAQPPAGLCADLGLVLRTMRAEPGSFKAGRPAPGFALFAQCRAHREGFIDEIVCSWRLPSAAPAVEGLATEALRCLPGARRGDDPTRPGEAQLFYEVQTISVGQSGDEALLVIAMIEG